MSEWKKRIPIALVTKDDAALTGLAIFTASAGAISSTLLLAA